MSQVVQLSAVREHNEVRAVSNQGYIGGLYFLVALAMVQYAVMIALIQAYVLPLKRFEHVNASFANPKVVTIIYAAKLTVLYFLISMTGGMTGFIVSSSVLLLWALALIFVGVIRRCCRFSEENEEEEAAEDPDAIPDDQALQRKPTIRGRSMLRRNEEVKDPWAGSPAPMAPGQLGAVMVSLLLLVLNVATMLMIIYLWEVPEYRVVANDDTMQPEFQPQLTAKALQFMYAFPEMAVTLQLDVYVKLLTEYCGVTYTRNITDAGEKRKLIYDDWIAKYDINMSDYVIESYLGYNSVNDWFTRAIDLSTRPMPSSVRAITSPADARTLIFQSTIESRQWFKGYELNVRELIGGVLVNGDRDYFVGGGMVISRLAPQDYHRFHSPVAGTITHIEYVPGSLWSVSADAARSGNDVFLNQRQVVIIDAGAVIGKVAFVAIGATCVGSVVLQDASGAPLAVGQLIDKGNQLGIMQFGGSTVVTLFAPDRIEFDEDLKFRSSFPVETFLQVNTQIGLSRQ
uniref:Phosphatidylserine decarboxylase n=1 Tax=Neobodo designis TaxID=312471 RepID=A0A7S1MC57_NEODS|mmetsp:Transcript_37800/g.116794  ORF Transcript_37800/g.116794 Transcript_37800/m.116794 type:complete len:515 (+) Transcript_37800:127-1671(+)